MEPEERKLIQLGAAAYMPHFPGRFVVEEQDGRNILLACPAPSFQTMPAAGLALFRGLATRLAEAPAFFVLEVIRRAPRGMAELVDEQGRELAIKNVYYLDDIDAERLGVLLDDHGALLRKEALLRFGYGAHSGADEVYVGRGGVLYVFTRKGELARETLEAAGLRQLEPQSELAGKQIDDFPAPAPPLAASGEREIAIQELLERLEAEGLYFAEQRFEFQI